ncbi:MAG: hypothetical protein AB7H81_19700 [Vicinamibacterales bacterium]
MDDAYLIKGIAGRILWELLRIHEGEQRVQFTNREIRLDESLQLPEIRDNLEARLILLRRRLAEKSEVLRLVLETGAGASGSTSGARRSSSSSRRSRRRAARGLSSVRASDADHDIIKHHANDRRHR